MTQQSLTMTKHNQAHAAFVTTSFVSNPGKKMASMILFVTRISDKGEEFLKLHLMFMILSLLFR